MWQLASAATKASSGVDADRIGIDGADDSRRGGSGDIGSAIELPAMRPAIFARLKGFTVLDMPFDGCFVGAHVSAFFFRRWKASRRRYG